jgi:hypothetical protein
VNNVCDAAVYVAAGATCILLLLLLRMLIPCIVARLQNMIVTAIPMESQSDVVDVVPRGV